MGVSECQQCGACCRGLLWILVNWGDRIREPRLNAVVEDPSEGQSQDMRQQVFALAGPGRLCPFLSGRECMIYDTRPEACRHHEPGGPHCLQCRLAYGACRTAVQPAGPVSIGAK